MAIAYPINLPDSIGIAQISLRAVNANTTSQSPFTYKQQVISFGGEKWEASISVPPVHKDLAAPWKSFLVALRGYRGTFLLGDPDYVTPQGSASSCVVTGNAGDETVSVVMTGSLLAGDYIQLGSGADSKLHMVLQDLEGDGLLELWPALRTDYTNETAVLNSPKGVFRLGSNTTEWDINNASVYGISFEAIEAI